MQEVHHVLSYGGGVNSTALMILLVREGLPLDGVVFADTGGEVPETYAYLDIAREFLRAHGIPLTVVAKTGLNLYDTAWGRRLLPSAGWRWSARDFKVNPILRHYRSLGGHVNQYLALAWDDVESMKDSTVSYVTHLYPLIDRRITRQECEGIVESAGLPLPPKSACFFCPFNTLERWRWIYEHHSELYEKAAKLEERSFAHPPQRLANQAFQGGSDLSLRELGQLFGGRTPLPLVSDREPRSCGGECLT